VSIQPLAAGAASLIGKSIDPGVVSYEAREMLLLKPETRNLEMLQLSKAGLRIIIFLLSFVLLFTQREG